MNDVARSRVHQIAATLAELAAWRVRHGLTAHQSEVVVHLYDNGAITSADLSRAIGITTASMARLVARLEASGWLRRVPDERDGRRVVLHPSKQLVRAIEELDGAGSSGGAQRAAAPDDGASGERVADR